MKQIRNTASNSEQTVTLRSELLALVAPVQRKIDMARVFEIALLVLLYATFLVSVALIVLMNQCVISPATAFYTLVPLTVASVMLFVRVVCIRR